jgi:hypothetical protein
MVCPTTITNQFRQLPNTGGIASALLDGKTPDALACKGIKYQPAADTWGNPPVPLF